MNRGAERLQGGGKLLRHGPVYAAVKVESNTEPYRLHRGHALQCGVERLGTFKPAEILGRVHLAAVKP
jgi:hypothetical protein